MIFLSEFLNADIVDVRQHHVGKVRDLIALSAEPYPRITGVVIKGNRKLVSLDWSLVRSFDRGELTLRVAAGEARPHQPAENELWLSREVLDKQIVDTDGHRLVRVNDLQLSPSNGSLLLVGVDIGERGLVRRLGLEGAGRRIAGWLKLDWPQKCIAWDTVEPLPADPSTVKLRISQQKLAKLHPADIAEIVHGLGPEERTAVFTSLDKEIAADTLQEMSTQAQASIISQLDDARASDILEAMEPDEAADLLADLPSARAQELLRGMEQEEAGDVETLLRYDEHTAGGLMTTQFVALPDNLSAAAAIEKLRELAPDAQTIYYVYVVDEQGRLKGVLSLRDLIVAKPERPIAELMIRKLVSIHHGAKPREVAALISKYNLLALPVVDRARRLLGIVTVDDAMESVLPARARRPSRH
jgi:CBS domain-containing protein/sporulation protein YlmC with PRC-barrel domain